MVKKWLVLFILLLSARLIYGQYDSILLEIKNIPDSKNETISKARRLIYSGIIAGDIEKVRQIRDFLKIEIEDENHQAFDIFENWLILFWTGEYNMILEQSAVIGLKYDNRTFFRIGPSSARFDDNLLVNLKRLSSDNQAFLIKNISSGDPGQEQMDFLNLLLEFCLADFPLQPVIQEKLNNKSESFILNYPYSPNGPFVKKIIQYKFKTSAFAIGYGLSGSFSLLGEQISSSLTNPGGIGINFDVFYKRFFFDFSLSVAASELKKDIGVSPNLWEKDFSASLVVPQVFFGYGIFNSTAYSMVPLVGLSIMNISPVYDDIVVYQHLEDINFTSGVSFSAGLSLNFFSKPSGNQYYLHRSHIYQVYTRIKYIYTALAFEQDEKDFSGSMHQISLMFGFMSRKVTRVY